MEEQSTEVMLNHLMFDRLGACRQSKKRTCLDLFLYHGANVSGTYEIKPENAILSFQVTALSCAAERTSSYSVLRWLVWLAQSEP